MNLLEKEVAVAEAKRLLTEVELLIRDASYNLAFDNLDKLPQKIDYVRALLDIIDNKANSFVVTENNEDELY